MRTTQVSVTGVAASVALPLDPYTVGAPEGLFLDVGAGCTVSVEATPDNVFDPTVTPGWFALPAPLAGATADQAVALGFAVKALRLNQTVGANTTTLKVVSRGIR